MNGVDRANTRLQIRPGVRPSDLLIARARWWLLPHIGYYLDDTPDWRWWMRPARWAWIALGWLPRSELFR